MDSKVKERLKVTTRPLYDAAVREMERRRRNEHLLVIRLMHPDPPLRIVRKPRGALYFYSRLEADKGIDAALLRDPFYN